MANSFTVDTQLRFQMKKQGEKKREKKYPELTKSYIVNKLKISDSRKDEI